MKQNDIEVAKATVITLLSFADDECSNLHESAEYVIKTIDAQAERIKELEGEAVTALGFAYAWLCTAAMCGKDITQVQCPELLDAWDRANGKKTPKVEA